MNPETNSSDPVEPTAAPSVEAPVVETPTDERPKNSFKAIDSQEALDRIIQERLARDRESRAKKYGDLDELYEKASKLDDIEREKLGDIEKRDLTIQELTKKLESLEGELSKRDFEKLRSDIAAEKGVPAHLAGRLRGESKEELEADAEELLAAIKPKKAPSERPEPAGGGVAPTSESAGFDPKSLADELLGRY